MERLLPVNGRRSGRLAGVAPRDTFGRFDQMADRDRSQKDKSADTETPSGDELAKMGKDVMRGRSFAGNNIAATQRIQTDERQRVADHGGENLDEFGEVTDAEIEAREMRRAERNED
jgi:hypothetical protein